MIKKQWYKVEGKRIQLNRVKCCNTFLSRLLGLMFKKELKENEGVLIYPCNSIHTCFMKMPIDVVFLDKDLRVLRHVKELKPWRLVRVVKGSIYCLEYSAGLYDIDHHEIIKINKSI